MKKSGVVGVRATSSTLLGILLLGSVMILVFDVVSFELALAGPPQGNSLSPSPYGTVATNLFLSAFAVGFLLVARHSLYGQGYAAALPAKPQRIRKLIRGAALMAAAMVLASWIRFALELAVNAPPPTASAKSWSDLGLAERIISSAKAGLLEEVFSVAVPLGLSYATAQIIRSLCQPQRAGLLVTVITTAAVTASLAGRIAGHLYQSPLAGTTAALWGAAALAIAWRYRSVWTVIVGHVTYNLFFTAGTVLPTFPGLHPQVTQLGLLCAIYVSTWIPGPLRRPS